jgi:hypothetical protein
LSILRIEWCCSVIRGLDHGSQFISLGIMSRDIDRLFLPQSLRKYVVIFSLATMYYKMICEIDEFCCKNEKETSLKATRCEIVEGEQGVSIEPSLANNSLTPFPTFTPSTLES